MADPTIQSNGRIGVLQQFMLDNREKLNEIPGVSFEKGVLVKNERTEVDGQIVKVPTDKVDDILGSGTATAIESILIAAGLPEGSAFDADAQKKLSEFLIKNGMDEATVAAFTKDVGVVLNNKDLGPYYQSLAKADSMAINKAIQPDAALVKAPELATAPTDPVDVVAEEAREPAEETPPTKDTKGSEGYRSNQGGMYAVDEQDKNPIPEDARFKSTMALNPETLVNRDGQVVTPEPKPVWEEYGLDSMWGPLHEPVKVEQAQPTLKGEEMMFVHNSHPKHADIVEGSHKPVISPELTSIVGAFKDADSNNSPAALDVTQKGDLALTKADIDIMKVGEPDARQLAVIALFEQQHAARIEANPEFIKLNKEIAEIETGKSAHRDDLQACLKNFKATAMILDDVRGKYIEDKDNADQKLWIDAVIDGKEERLELSLNDIRNDNIPGVGYFEFMDRANVEEAFYAQFYPAVDRNLMRDSKAYAEQVAQFNQDSERLIGKGNITDTPINSFAKKQGEVLFAFWGPEKTGGEFDDIMRKKTPVSDGRAELIDIKALAKQMEQNIDQGVYIVKQTDIAAMMSKNEMLAQSDATQDRTLASVGAPPL
jgi:hypothetical protein